MKIKIENERTYMLGSQMKLF